MTLSYPVRVQQAREGLGRSAALQPQRQLIAASNVRPASVSLLHNRMDTLSFRMGRLSCAGLE